MTYLEVVPKWVQLSVRRAFTGLVQNAPVYFEEIIKKPPDTKPQVGLELRIDGPYTQFIGTRNEVECQFEINVLATWAYHERDTMGLVKLCGVVQAALARDFCIYRLGTETYDNETYFETLQWIADDRVETSNYGQIDVINKVYQSSIEAHYKVRFSNGTI